MDCRKLIPIKRANGYESIVLFLLVVLLISKDPPGLPWGGIRFLG